MNELYDAWVEADKKLKLYKKVESDLRMKICNILLDGKKSGVHNFDSDDYQVKATKNETISLDADLLSFIWDDLTEEEQACIKYKPSFSKNEYKKCENHEMLDQAITIKPAMPALKIVKVEKSW